MLVNTDAATRSNLLPEGQYDAVVKRAEEKISKGGNGMIELIVTVYHGDQEVDVWDWLLADDAWQWKVKQCCDSAGIDYTTELDSRDFVDKNVRVNLVQRAKEKGDKRKLEQIPEAERVNGIKGYLLRTSENGAPVSVARVRGDKKDDDLPF